MSDTDEGADRKRRAVEQLNEALASEDIDEVKYHVRQALQLLDVE